MTSLMSELLDRVEGLPIKIDSNNHPSTYLPFRNKDTDLDYEILAGRVISCVTHRDLKPGASLDTYRERARATLRKSLAIDSPLPQIEEAYLDGGGFTSIAPEFALLRGKGPAATRHLAFVFQTLLWSGSQMSLSAPGSVNFLERTLLQLFQSDLLMEESSKPNADCYLPFLADTCRTDLQFLLKHPQYFLAEKRRFLELYAFLYTSQLALALESWSCEPQPRPQYFILETEKASRDRPSISDGGYKHVRQAALRLFPILSLLNYFNRAPHQYPLWRFAQALEHAGERRDACNARIAEFAKAFREARELEPKVAGNEPLKLLVDSSRDQFAKGRTREGHLRRYMGQFEEHFASPFVETRGRAGSVLVMRQDCLLLATNICIGENDEAILFPELMRRFNARGIFWDQDSQVELVNFYRRVGNVNALSDTGDAVYVAKAL